MNAITSVKKFISENPLDDSAKALNRLVSAIEAGGFVDVADVYGLDLEQFNLALQLLQE